MIVTEATIPLVSSLVAHASRHLTLKQAKNGNLLIGGGWYAGLDPITGWPRTIRDSIEGSLAVATAVMPPIGALKVLRTWAAMNIDIDGAPILGEHPTQKGFYTAVGANGYTLGPLFGQITAGLITQNDAGLDIAPFALNRFGSR
jgi:glycine/D-amino acid oxidase-like deaminating enzyme